MNYYDKGSTKLERIKDDVIFEVKGSLRPYEFESDFNYGDHLDVSACVKELDGVVIFCGSYSNPVQNSFTYKICGKSADAP